MSPPDPASANPRRFSIRLPRPLWIGMAAAVLVVVAVGLQIGVPAYRQGVAVHNIRRLGGEVIKFEVGPDWLRSWLGDERMEIFDHIESVRFTDGAQATDEALAQLAALPNLRELDIGDSPNAPITASGIARAGRLQNIATLYLRDTALDDAGLAALPALPRLRRLFLWKTPITDRGLEQLIRYPSLEALELNSDFTDRGLEYVVQLRNLRKLVANSPYLTDKGLVNVSSLIHLEELHISAKQISAATTEHLAILPELQTLGLGGATDDALVPLRRCADLKSLRVAGAQVTDLGVEHVSAISGLEHLSLNRTGATDAGLANLLRLTRLISLSLVGEQFTDGAMEHIKRLEHLRALHLTGTHVSDSAIEELKTLRSGLQVVKSAGRMK